MSENVKPIPSAPGYFASSDGALYSTKKGTMSAVRPNKVGKYHGVSVYIDGRQQARLVHRLICEAFHGLPSPGEEVRHLDGNPTNNAASNLAWGTRAENMGDKRRHGTAQVGEKNPLAKLRTADVVRIRERAANGETQTAIAADYGVTQANVREIVTGKTWQHVTIPDMSGRVTRSGENHMSAKLTQRDVDNIRRRVASGERIADVARIYGVTAANVGMIVRGNTWKASYQGAA